MTDDVVLNKVATIERCLTRIRDEYRSDPERLELLTVEDSVVLNLQRACEASIDLAMRMVSGKRLGVPQSSHEAFTLLEQAGALDSDLARRLGRMVGFRNIAVHDYTKLSRPILIRILDDHLNDFVSFCKVALEQAEHPSEQDPE